MNKVCLMGRLTKDPEVRYSQGADPMAMARYTLAVNRRMGKNGEQQADFIACVAFGKSGEFAEKYFKKGQMVGLVGRLQVRSWEDDAKKKHWVTEVIAEEQYFGGNKGSSTPSTPQATGEAPEGFYPTEDTEDGDLPF